MRKKAGGDPGLFHCEAAPITWILSRPFLILKAAISGILIALASEVARRFPGLGRDTQDTERLAQHSISMLWFLAPWIPMFFLIPYGLRQGWGF